MEWLRTTPIGWLTLAVLGILTLVTAFSIAVGYAWERMAQRAGRTISAMPLKRGQRTHEILGTVLFHAVFVPPLAYALHTGLIRFSDGWLANLLGFAVPWYGFVALYYALHRSMHARRLFWMHRWHHDSVVTTPVTGFSMHPIEAAGWTLAMLVPSIVLARFQLLGVGGWLVYLGSLWFGNIVGHANAELWPWRSEPWMTTSVNPISYHSLHHLRFDGHYGFGNALFDRLFGTEFPDWLAIHDRVRTGKPLTSPREKMPDRAAS